MAADGQLVAYNQHYYSFDNDYCANHDMNIVFNAAGNIVWPADVEKNCLLKQQFSDIPESKIAEYVPAFIEQQRKKNGRYSFSYSGEDNLLQGPTTIDINGVATLTLPEGYAYLALDDSYSCHGYIYSKTLNDLHWRICVVSKDIGYIKSSAISRLGTNETKLRDRLIKKNSETYITTLENRFNWLISPKYDATKHSLIWGYEIEQYNQLRENQNYVIYYDTASLVMFGRSKVIALQNHSGLEAKAVAPHLAQFADLITFNSSEAYQENPDFPCNLLPEGDQTISEIDDFLPYSDRCFMYSPEVLIMGFPNNSYYSNSSNNLKRFINNYSRPGKLTIN